MIDIDRAAHELALAYADKYSGYASSTEAVLQAMANRYYDAYSIIEIELRHRVELDEEID